MTMKMFIAYNREIIDEVIMGQIKDNTFHITDKERELWIMNWEPLYIMARRQGVKV